MKSLEDRFWSKVDKRGPNDCWNWIGSRVPDGYGNFKVIGTRAAKKNDSAHRVSYRLNTGPIPAGLFVLHRCDNPACVNPGHLTLGTHQDNMDDMRRKGRGPCRGGAKNLYAKLTDAAIAEIRARREPPLILAKKFGVHQCTIYRVLEGVRWNGVPAKKPKAPKLKAAA